MNLKKNNQILLAKVIIFSIISGVFNCILIWFSGIETCKIAIESIVIPNLGKLSNEQVALMINEFFFIPRLVFMVLSSIFFGVILFILIKEHKAII